MAGPAEVAASVRAAYERRMAKGLDGRYEYREPTNLFIYQGRERALLSLLRENGLLPLTGRQILDAGCGDGNVLLDLVRYGGDPSSLSGVDLLEDRIARARELLPAAALSLGDIQSLAFPDASFDLVLAFTLLSSVVNPAGRAGVTRELVRVTRPGGLVVVYDFWLNPFNRNARSVKRSELRALFPGRKVDCRSITLAPPLVRLFVPRRGGWVAASILEMLPFLRSHFLAAVHC